MPAFASGQTRLAALAARSLGARRVRERVRASALGPFVVSLVLALGGCAAADRHALAVDADRRDRTGLYAWLVDHDPSALVAWRVSPETLRPFAPDARTIVAAGRRPCVDAVARHAALVLVASAASPQGRRDRFDALDCGVALFRDGGAMVIAPR